MTLGRGDILRGPQREEEVLRGDQDGVVHTGEAGLAGTGVVTFKTNYYLLCLYIWRHWVRRRVSCLPLSDGWNCEINSSVLLL